MLMLGKDNVKAYRNLKSPADYIISDNPEGSPSGNGGCETEAVLVYTCSWSIKATKNGSRVFEYGSKEIRWMVEMKKEFTLAYCIFIYNQNIRT